MKGLHSLESLFPGMQDKLLTAGARRVDVMRNFLWVSIAPALAQAKLKLQSSTDMHKYHIPV